MTDTVHIYDMQGRCVRSAPLATRPPIDDAASRIGATTGLRKTLLDLGLVLTEWADDERCGMASIGGEARLVRIKPDTVQRDMRKGGVALHLEAVRAHGSSVDVHDAWMLSL